MFSFISLALAAWWAVDEFHQYKFKAVSTFPTVQGAMTGLIVGLVLSLWIGFGQPKPEPIYKPRSTDGCDDGFNISTTSAFTEFATTSEFPALTSVLSRLDRSARLPELHPPADILEDPSSAYGQQGPSKGLPLKIRGPELLGQPGAWHGVKRGRAVGSDSSYTTDKGWTTEDGVTGGQGGGDGGNGSK